MRSRVSLGWYMVAFLWLALGLSGQTVSGSNPATTDLAWMAGTWEGEVWGGHNVESWTAPGTDGTMLGSYRFAKGGKPVFYELMAIEMENGARVMRMRHFGAGLVSREEKDAALRFAVEQSVATEVVFRQIFPTGQSTKLRYRLAGPAQLEVELIKGEGEKQTVQRFAFRKAAGAN